MTRDRSGRAFRVGIGGPVGSGKTALVEQLVPRLIALGMETVVVTNDIVTTEDAEHVRRTLSGLVEPERVIGVETGSCPHTAVREDPTMNLAALESLAIRYPDARVALVESGGDNLTLTFSRRLVDYSIYVIDVAGGDKIPRKRGPGVLRSDLLVINKQDLAPYVGASLDVMATDSERFREGKPYVFTNCKTGEGVGDVMEYLVRELDAAEGRRSAAEQPAAGVR